MTMLSLLTPPFLCHRSLPIPPVPYPPRSGHRFCPLVRVCVCLSSAATSILAKPFAFSLPPRYLYSCMVRPLPSYIYHPSISASLRFTLPLQYVISTPPSTPFLSILLLSIYTYLYLYLLPLPLSLLYLSLTLCIYLFLFDLLVSRPLTHFITIYS